MLMCSEEVRLLVRRATLFLQPGALVKVMTERESWANSLPLGVQSVGWLFLEDLDPPVLPLLLPLRPP